MHPKEERYITVAELSRRQFHSRDGQPLAQWEDCPNGGLDDYLWLLLKDEVMVCDKNMKLVMALTGLKRGRRDRYRRWGWHSKRYIDMRVVKALEATGAPEALYTKTLPKRVHRALKEM